MLQRVHASVGGTAHAVAFTPSSGAPRKSEAGVPLARADGPTCACRENSKALAPVAGKEGHSVKGTTTRPKPSRAVTMRSDARPLRATAVVG